MAFDNVTAFAILMLLLLFTSFAYSGSLESGVRDFSSGLSDFASNFGESGDWFIIFAVLVLIVFLSNSKS